MISARLAIASMFLIGVAMAGCAKVQANGPEVYWITMPCDIDTTVPIRVEIESHPPASRLDAESAALHDTVWSDEEWRAYLDLDPNGPTEIRDQCRATLAKSWGYVPAVKP